MKGEGRGAFIALEGVEGAGKTTQAARLADRLRGLGHDVLSVREPGGTPFAEEVRRLLLHAPHDLTAQSEVFLFQAARADLTAHVIRPALEAGRVVVADRFELTTRTYQIGGRGLPAEPVTAAIALATGGLEPDLYVILDVPVATGKTRQAAQGKGPDRLEREAEAFHARVAEAYRAARGPNIVHIPAEGSADAVFDAIWRATLERLPSLAR
jgi:dTMP kinase